MKEIYGQMKRLLRKNLVAFISVLMIAVSVKVNSVHGETNTADIHTSLTPSLYDASGKKVTNINNIDGNGMKLAVNYSLVQAESSSEKSYISFVRDHYNIASEKSIDILWGAKTNFRIGSVDPENYDGHLDYSLEITNGAYAKTMDQSHWYLLYIDASGHAHKLTKSSDYTITTNSNGAISKIVVKKLSKASGYGNGTYYLVEAGTKTYDPDSGEVVNDPTTNVNIPDGENGATVSIPVVYSSTNRLYTTLTGKFNTNPAFDETAFTNISKGIYGTDIASLSPIKVDLSGENLNTVLMNDNLKAVYDMTLTIENQSENPKWDLLYFDENGKNPADITNELGTSLAASVDSDGYYKVHFVTEHKQPGYYVIVEEGKKIEEMNASNPIIDGKKDSVQAYKMAVHDGSTNEVTGYIKAQFDGTPRIDFDQMNKASADLIDGDMVQIQALAVAFSQWENDDSYKKLNQKNYSLTFGASYAMVPIKNTTWRLLYYPDKTFTNGVDITDQAKITTNNNTVSYTTTYKKNGYYVLVEVASKENTAKSEYVTDTSMYYGYEERFYGSNLFKIKNSDGKTENVAYCNTYDNFAPLYNGLAVQGSNDIYFNLYHRYTDPIAYWQSLSEKQKSGIRSRLGITNDDNKAALTIYDEVSKAIYYGYHDSSNGVKDDPAGLFRRLPRSGQALDRNGNLVSVTKTDYERWITQLVIHYFTDGVDVTHNKFANVTDNNGQISEIGKIAQKMVDMIKNNSGPALPSGKAVYFYKFDGVYKISNPTADEKNNPAASQRKEKVSLPFSVGSKPYANSQDMITAHFENSTEKLVYISKKNIGGENLSGAKIQIVNDQQTAVKYGTYTTDGSDHLLSLEPGIYTFHEVSAPAGYRLVEDFQFKVEQDGHITVVDAHGNMVSADDNKLTVTDLSHYTVKFNKVDEHGEFVAGAKLKLTKNDDPSFKQITWITGTSPHIIDDLPNGQYTLSEVEAPHGYAKAESQTFILDQKTTQPITIQMVDQEAKKTFTVTKTWGTGTTPKAIKVKLLKDGYRVLPSERPNDYEVTLDSNNNWTYTWTKLDNNGTYSAEEAANDDGTVPVLAKTIKTFEKITRFDDLKKGDQLVFIATNHQDKALGVQEGTTNASTASHFRFVDTAFAAKANGEKYLVNLPSDDALWTVDRDPAIRKEDNNVSILLKSATYPQLYMANFNGNEAANLADKDHSYPMSYINSNLYYGGETSNRRQKYWSWNMKYSNEKQFYCQAPNEANTLTFDVYKLGIADVQSDHTDRFTLENQKKNKQKIKIQIKKFDVDHTNTLLPGAIFQIYKADQDGSVDDIKAKGEKVGDAIRTNRYGIAMSGELDPNTTYYLLETKAPAGYKSLDHVIKFKAMGNDDSSKIMIESEKDRNIYVTDDTLYIGNKKEAVYELPDTGGQGVLPYRLFGIFSLIVAIFMYMKKRRIAQ